MAVSKKWLAEVRARNRQKLGMAGMSGLGQGTAHLQAAFNKPPPQPSQGADRVGTPLPPVSIPAGPQIPKAVLYVGGALLFGLFALTAVSVIRGRS